MIRMDPNADLLIEWNIRLRSNRRGEAPVRGKKCRKQKASHPPEILKHGMVDGLSARERIAVRSGRPR